MRNVKECAPFSSFGRCAAARATEGQGLQRHVTLVRRGNPNGARRLPRAIFGRAYAPSGHLHALIISIMSWMSDLGGLDPLFVFCLL